jgi:hypothetical protein
LLKQQEGRYSRNAERGVVAAPKRKPMPEIADKLAAVTNALEGVRAAERDLDAAREKLRTAIRAAHRAGASYGLLGQLTGLSPQRVAQLSKR